ncbi:U1 small nuclear ribonucleoprotein 70 kDa-like [Abrus precatorius]|uniref:U1 small nuclear ribonucleoprotein 70 kDa-like n=1 Tax=Abrus precatorius TaxID=3816 RepID=A0A8B8MMQ5_ABRPR|nr:U1 small nuclear ribonucleoprotein 70 kDa-like [Abrus precatorius]
MESDSSNRSYKSDRSPRNGDETPHPPCVANLMVQMEAMRRELTNLQNRRDREERRRGRDRASEYSDNSERSPRRERYDRRRREDDRDRHRDRDGDRNRHRVRDEDRYREEEDRNTRHRRDSKLKEVKLEVPHFHGKDDIEAYLEWEMKVEQLFICHNIEEEKKVKIAIFGF